MCDIEEPAAPVERRYRSSTIPAVWNCVAVQREGMACARSGHPGVYDQNGERNTRK